MAKKVRDAIRTVERDGWYYSYTKGSHRQFYHPTKSGKVTIPGKPSDDVERKLWSYMMKQAGLSELY